MEIDGERHDYNSYIISNERAKRERWAVNLDDIFELPY